jgi:HEPN domain-containing protein
LRKATDDLTMARRLAGDAASPDWGIGFHVQQVVEKSLKAVLCSRGIDYPRTHSISVLLDLLAEHSLSVPMARESMVILTAFGVLFRYDEMGPTDAELAHLPDRASMLAMADAVAAWARATARP